MTKEFWKAALIRAIKTVCQTAVATIGTAIVVTDVNWVYVLSASALAGILSIMESPVWYHIAIISNSSSSEGP